MEFGAVEPGAEVWPRLAALCQTFYHQRYQKIDSTLLRTEKVELDNIHDIRLDQGLFVPGCRPSIFDCFHIHWRWNPAAVDPVSGLKIDPNLAGTPYSVPG
ncbi:MAG TPA: hypothetical protein VF884_08080 [Nitrososphaeraceae archaeon]